MSKLKIFIIAFIGFLSVACNNNINNTKEAQTYAFLEIKPRDIELSKKHSASIRGEKDTKIIPRVDGHLTNVSVTEGEKVKKGQIMFVIDPAPYIAQLNATKASVGICEANVATAKLNYESKKKLFAKEIISNFDLLSSENALKTAEAQLEQAKAQQLLAETNLSYTQIKSPSNGVVGKIPYREGDYVSPAIMDGLTIVADNDIMNIYFSMSERKIMDYISNYGSVEEAIASIPEIELILSNQKTYDIKGKIVSISGIVDQNTGSVSVRALFPNPKQLLLSGATGNVVLPYQYKNAFVIPQGATYEIQDKTFVYRVIDGKAVSTIITVEPINNGKEFIVSSGLAEGDIIIAEGAGLVREGIAVIAK